MVTYFFSNCQTAHAFLTCGLCEFSLPVQLFQLSCCMLGCALHICQHLPDKSIHVEYTKMALGCCRRVAVPIHMSRHGKHHQASFCLLHSSDPCYIQITNIVLEPSVCVLQHIHLLYDNFARVCISRMALESLLF